MKPGSVDCMAWLTLNISIPRNTTCKINFFAFSEQHHIWYYADIAGVVMVVSFHRFHLCIIERNTSEKQMWVYLLGAPSHGI